MPEKSHFFKFKSLNIEKNRNKTCKTKQDIVVKG